MSSRTSETTTPLRAFAPARVAAAGLLALAGMLPLGATASAAETAQLVAAVQPHVVAAQARAQVIEQDLDDAERLLCALPKDLRDAVRDAVSSVRAATAEARTALSRATDEVEAADGRAAAALFDAQVALDAAAAQLRFVSDQVAGVDADVVSALARLQEHVDGLRGEASRAA
jgi:hypothetical protein